MARPYPTTDSLSPDEDFMTLVLRELRQAAHRLGRRPLFAVTGMLTLALGVGATPRSSAS